MNIAITGGTGFLGRSLARALTSQNHLVKLIARGVDKSDESIKKQANIAFTPVVYTDDKQLVYAMSGCDVVVHLAGINRETEKGEFKRVHVDFTLRVLGAARKAGARKVIYVSFIRARKTPFSAYHNSKFEAEELVRNSGLDYTIFKPGIIFGSHDHMVSHIARALDIVPFVGLFPTVGILEKKLAPIAVEDMVKIMMAAILDDRLSRQTVAVIGPEELKLSECVQRVARAMGKPALVCPVPAIAQAVVASAMEKAMRKPLVSVAQVSMLSESMIHPLPDSELLPSDLLPQTRFTEETIKPALPSKQSAP